MFGWKFTDYGPDYTSFEDGRLSGGFTTDSSGGKGVLIVLYSDNLEMTLGAVKSFGANITREIYSFPGGRRFHFMDVNGNELAVWGEDPNSTD